MFLFLCRSEALRSQSLIVEFREKLERGSREREKLHVTESKNKNVCGEKRTLLRSHVLWVFFSPCFFKTLLCFSVTSEFLRFPQNFLEKRIQFFQSHSHCRAFRERKRGERQQGRFGNFHFLKNIKMVDEVSVVPRPLGGDVLGRAERVELSRVAGVWGSLSLLRIYCTLWGK